jgi:hypothetical protein
VAVLFEPSGPDIMLPKFRPVSEESEKEWGRQGRLGPTDLI